MRFLGHSATIAANLWGSRTLRQARAVRRRGSPQRGEADRSREGRKTVAPSPRGRTRRPDATGPRDRPLLTARPAGKARAAAARALRGLRSLSRCAPPPRGVPAPPESPAPRDWCWLRSAGKRGDETPGAGAWPRRPFSKRFLHRRRRTASPCGRRHPPRPGPPASSRQARSPAPGNPEPRLSPASVGGGLRSLSARLRHKCPRVPGVVGPCTFP